MNIKQLVAGAVALILMANFVVLADPISVGAVDAENAKRVSEIKDLKEAAESGDADAQYKIAKLYLQANEQEGIQEATRWLERASKNGHSQAQVDYARWLKTFAEIKNEPSLEIEAFQWNLVAAKQNNCEAAYKVGIAFATGNGIEEDDEAAIEWLEKAAACGGPFTKLQVAKLYDMSRVLPENNELAVKWYKVILSADQDTEPQTRPVRETVDSCEGEEDVDCYRGKAEEFLAHLNAPEQAAEEFETAQALAGLGFSNGSEGWLRKAANHGHAEAQYLLGLRYYFGEGLTKNTEIGVGWLRKAAEQGIPKAQYFLGSAYEDGDGVAPNTDEAMRWYREAAAQGDPAAQWRLGVLLETGVGVKQDLIEAQKWYRFAAVQESNDLGISAAQSRLGRLYYDGRGVPQDFTEAIGWFRKAAERGNSYARNKLAYMCLRGEGQPRDSKAAMKWYLEAANEGYATAQYNLGVLYNNGDGVVQDYVEAHMWANLAAASENDPDRRKDCAALRDSIAEKMTAAQIAKAQERAKMWMKEFEARANEAE